MRYGSMEGSFFVKEKILIIDYSSRYTKSLKDPITTLLTELQPDAIMFNGYGLTINSARWIGSEIGVAPDPNWSTGISNNGGDPNSPIFCPAECDTTLQLFDRWFWVGKEINAISN